MSRGNMTPSGDVRCRVGNVGEDLSGAPGATARACPVRQTGMLGGTLILTAKGLQPVEALRGGDLVATLLPRGPFFVPVAWVGARPASLAGGGARPDWPVLIRRHAIGQAMPATDILVAPEHAIYIGEALYLPRMLINGRSITYQRPASPVTQYWGIGLDIPNVVLAHNLPVETLMPHAAAAFAGPGVGGAAAWVPPKPPRRRPALRLVEA